MPERRLHPDEDARAPRRCRSPVERAGHLGIDAAVDKVRWTDVRDRIFGRIDPISMAGRDYRTSRCPHLTFYEGYARFTGPRRLMVDLPGGPVELTADRIVVAAGSRPTVPPVVAESGAPFHTSDTVMRIDALPEHVVILGSGYIAAEFAHVLSALGSAVSAVGRSAPTLRGQDETVRERFTELARGRWDVHLGQEPTRVPATAPTSSWTWPTAPWCVATSCWSPPAAARTATGWTCTGRASPLTPTAGSSSTSSSARPPTGCSPSVTSAHLPAQARGEPRIHRSGAQPAAPRRAVAHRPPVRASAVFTEPQIAAVGRTEQECRADGLDYAVRVQAYGDVAYGWAMEDDTGFCKVPRSAARAGCWART